MNSVHINLSLPSFGRSCRIMKINLYGKNHTVILTRSANIVNQWIKKQKLNQRSVRSVVGFGVQWNEGSFPAKVVQVAFKKSCLIFQIGQAISIPQQLKRLLVNRRISLVGVGNSTDAERILAAVPSLQVQKLINVRGSMISLAAEHLGLTELDFDKEVLRSNGWGGSHLSPAQVIHCASDAFLSLKIGSKIIV